MLEAKVNGDYIELPTGTRFGILTATKKGKQLKVKLVKAPEDSTFWALFEEDNVDFQILVDNSYSERRGIGYTISLNNACHDFYVDPARKCAPMEALEPNGRKLHFRVKADGRRKSEANNNVDASAYNRMQFKVEVEKVKPRAVAVEVEEEVAPDTVGGQSSKSTKSSLKGMVLAVFFARRLNKQEGPSDPIPGEAANQGIICFGKKSSQAFGPTYGEFLCDETYLIKPFVVEMRMASTVKL